MVKLYLLSNNIVMNIDRKTTSEIRANKEKLVMENFASIMKKLDNNFLNESEFNHAPYDENIPLRNLTPKEMSHINNSAKELGRDVDFTQDTAVRYISDYGKGHEMTLVVNYNTLHNVKVPEDAHIANVIGNMNYTDAYKEQGKN